MYEWNDNAENEKSSYRNVWFYLLNSANIRNMQDPFSYTYILCLNAAPAASFTISNDFHDRREKSFRPQKMLNNIKVITTRCIYVYIYCVCMHFVDFYKIEVWLFGVFRNAHIYSHSKNASSCTNHIIISHTKFWFVCLNSAWSVRKLVSVQLVYLEFNVQRDIIQIKIRFFFHSKH